MDSIETNKLYKEEKKKAKSVAKGISDREKRKVSLSKKLARAKIKEPKVSNTTKVKKKSKTRWQLVKELDAIFSKFIRQRDSDYSWICTCVTCWAKAHWKTMHCCHFLSRSNYKYRWDEDNCFWGCYRCNVILKWNYIPYTLFMINKYGKERVEYMQNDKELSKIKTADIIEKIEYYKNLLISKWLSL